MAEGEKPALEKLVGVAEDCPLLVDRSPILGRFLVAARDLREGEILLQESPLVLGPQAHSSPLCLGCYKPLGLMEQPRMCSRCKVAPICSSACEASPAHQRECIVFKMAHPQSNNLLTGEKANYQIILPLRCFLSQAKRLLQLESHFLDRRDTEAWFECEQTVVTVLHRHGLLRMFGVEPIQRICGILDVNSFEVRGPPDETGRSECLRGIYPNSSFMAHSCIQNTHVALGLDFTLTIKAAMNIAKGGTIYYNYSDALLCTPVRREHLRLGKYFSCECRRCSDPTELGTHLNSLRCPDSKCKGSVMCSDPLNMEHTLWVCNVCKRALENNVVNAGLMIVQRELMKVDRSDAKAMEALLTRFARSHHPQHAAMIELTQALSGLYREQIMDLDGAAPPALLKRKIELCASLLPVVEKLEPPLSRLRGITLYEMASPMILLAQQQARSLPAGELMARLQKAEGLLREGARLLLHEPAGAPEARLARLALLELRGVRQLIVDSTKKATRRARKKR